MHHNSYTTHPPSMSSALHDCRPHIAPTGTFAPPSRCIRHTHTHYSQRQTPHTTQTIGELRTSSTTAASRPDNTQSLRTTRRPGLSRSPSRVPFTSLCILKLVCDVCVVCCSDTCVVCCALCVLVCCVLLCLVRSCVMCVHVCCVCLCVVCCVFLCNVVCSGIGGRLCFHVAGVGWGNLILLCGSMRRHRRGMHRRLAWIACNKICLYVWAAYVLYCIGCPRIYACTGNAS